MIRKVAPCSGCGHATMCVSHDTFKFYCNRCLPYFVRAQMYWKEAANDIVNSTQKETTVEQIDPDVAEQNLLRRQKKTKN